MDDAATSTRATLAHDLRGPLITVEGFAAEIGEALTELERLLAAEADPARVAARLAELLDEDLRPCLGFVESAARTMHDRIDALGASSADKSGD